MQGHAYPFGQKDRALDDLALDDPLRRKGWSKALFLRFRAKVARRFLATRSQSGSIPRNFL
jgi:hypothetical protein